MFDKIVVGTDGYGPASKAVQRAAELAAESDAELIVVYAQPTAQQAEGNPLRDAGSVRGVDAAQGLLADVEKNFKDTARVRTTLEQGDPSEALIDVAETEGADLIVVGNKGMSQRFPLGVVANRVTHHAPCSVLVVRTVE